MGLVLLCSDPFISVEVESRPGMALASAPPWQRYCSLGLCSVIWYHLTEVRVVLRACSWSYFLHSFFQRSSKLNNQSAPLSPAFTVRCEPFASSRVKLVTYPLLTDLDILWDTIRFNVPVHKSSLKTKYGFGSVSCFGNSP